MEQLLLPTQIKLIKDKNPQKATLVVSPCHPGYGTTVGNALRRVLLSSLPGAAVTAVKIEGVDHEFMAIPHVEEDVVQIILNLKQLRLKVFSPEPVRLLIEVEGEREVSASDIAENTDVKIANPKLHIASLTNKDAKLKMEIFVRQGRGYVPIEEREDKKGEIGVIAIDSVFTPIRSVGYRVEDVRVGQKTNYDHLTLELETDGTIDPEEAVRQAARILLDHFNPLVNVEAMTARQAAKKKEVEDKVEDKKEEEPEKQEEPEIKEGEEAEPIGEAQPISAPEEPEKELGEGLEEGPEEEKINEDAVVEETFDEEKLVD